MLHSHGGISSCPIQVTAFGHGDIRLPPLGTVLYAVRDAGLTRAVILARQPGCRAVATLTETTELSTSFSAIVTAISLRCLFPTVYFATTHEPRPSAQPTDPPEPPTIQRD